MSRTDIRVLTYNVQSPSHGDWPGRRELIQAGIAGLDPDVVLLQEDTGDVLGEPWHIAAHTHRSGDGVGAALYSRWPITDVHELDLRLTDRVDLPWAAAVIAEIDTPSGPLMVAHHKPTYHVGYALERELQAVACARQIERLGNYVFVVAPLHVRDNFNFAVCQRAFMLNLHVVEGNGE